jgi:transcriptional regulator with XRE-family HTH domain
VSKAELAKLLGVSFSCVGQYQQGYASISEELIAEFCAILDIPTWQLFISPQEMERQAGHRIDGWRERLQKYGKKEDYYLNLEYDNR